MKDNERGFLYGIIMYLLCHKDTSSSRNKGTQTKSTRSAFNEFHEHECDREDY